MSDIQSLGYRTDLFFPQFDGEIIDRGSYKVILTPMNPTFFWGNYILFNEAPAEGDLENWERIFDAEIRSRLPVTHYAFGWDTCDGEPGCAGQFVDRGFSLLNGIVLVADKVNSPPKVNDNAIIRPLLEDWEWEQAQENQIACRGDDFSFEEYAPFKRDQMARYRKMSDAGWGHWFGAFLDGRLAADLGIFARNGVARFQSVGTNPEYRRLGLCGTLVYQASRYALEKMNAHILVMVADEGYFAAGIYESVGFRPKEHQIGLEWWPKI